MRNFVSAAAIPLAVITTTALVVPATANECASALDAFKGELKTIIEAKDTCQSKRDTLLELGQRYGAAAAATRKLRFDKLKPTTREGVIQAQVAFLESYLQQNVEGAKLNLAANELMLCHLNSDLDFFDALGRANAEHTC
ncbi:MAG: hypothetical protein F4X97_10995 [Boseongicola sp. SB0662_bin_57]|nr:hypothetical protein [Boseongicola sp. SB0662_bin_57]